MSLEQGAEVRTQVAERAQSQLVTAGDEVEAAVLQGGVVQGDPDGAGFADQFYFAPVSGTSPAAPPQPGGRTHTASARGAHPSQGRDVASAS